MRKLTCLQNMSRGAKAFQDNAAAIAFVSSHKTEGDATTPSASSLTDAWPPATRKTSAFQSGGDGDLQRALDLVDLHHAVKEKHKSGIDIGLQQARRDVKGSGSLMAF